MNKLTYSVRKLIVTACLLLASAVPMTMPAMAHAIIVSAEPAAGSTVTGPDIVVTFAFNVRVDASRSTLMLTAPDGSTRPVVIEASDNPAVLTGHVSGLSAGTYSVRWQVLATDGHITRGDVSFTVAP